MLRSRIYWPPFRQWE